MSRRVLCTLIVVLMCGAAPRAAAVAEPGTGSVLGPPDSRAGGKLGRELVNLRTRTSRTYVDAHGTRTARIFTGSVNYKAADGTWKPIDNTLLQSGQGFRNRAGQYTAGMPNSLGDGPVTIRRDDRWISFELQDAGGTPTTSGAGIRYRDALPGVEARYRVGSDSLKETFVLSGPNAARSFSFRLAMSAGLRPVLRRTGVLEFIDAHGAARFSFGAPLMKDAAGARSRRVHYTLDKDAGGWTLTTRAADAWLDAPDRKWPVAVDPGTYPVADPDCTLNEATPDTSGCSQDGIQIGSDGSDDRRALMRFDVDGALPFDAEIYASVLVMYLRSQTDSTQDPTPIGVHRVTRSWTPSASWSRYDGTNAWDQPGGDYDSTLEGGYARDVGGTMGAGRFYFWGIPDLSTSWARGEDNNGILLRDQDSGRNNVLTFDSSESAGTGPYLDIRYERRLGQRRGYKFEQFGLADRMTLEVNPGTGNLLLRQSDLTVPGGLGPDMTVGRTYNSFQPGATEPAYGTGWTMDTAGGIRLEDHGGYDQYLYGPSGYIVPFRYWDGTDFTSPPGFDAKLKREPDRRHILTENKSQTKYVFENAGADETAHLDYIEDRNGHRIRFAYDPSSFRVSTITDSQDRVTQFFYDAAGHVTRMVDSAGREYLYGYDPNGMLVTYTDPGGGVTHYDYTDGMLSQVTTPAGRVTTISYYPAGDPDAGKVQQIVRVTDPADGSGPTTTFSYTEHADSSSEATVTDPSGHDTDYSFDKQSRVTDATDALGHKQHVKYTSNSNVQQYFAPSNSTTSPSAQFDYDSEGNLVGSSVETGSTTPALETSAAYGGKTENGGSVTGGTYLASSTTDEQGDTTRLTYTTEGNLDRARRVDGNEATVSDVHLEYADGSPGKVTASVDGKGNRTTYGYDGTGNLTRITPPGPMGETTIDYSGHAGTDQALSRVSSVQLPDGRSETYDYDGLDRVTKVTFADGTSLSNTWDADGNLIGQQDTAPGAGSRTLQYDQLNRLTREAGPGAHYVDYGYDAAGNLTSVTDPNGTVQYGYDAANRNRSVFQPGLADPVNFDVDADGNRTEIDLPNGDVVEQHFNKAAQMLRTCTRPSGSADACEDHTGNRLLDFSYDYVESTANGDKSRRLQQSVTDVDGDRTSYIYDPVGRLLRAETRDSGDSVSDWFEYDYDAAGNILARRRQGSSDEAYAYNNANELCWRYVGASTGRDCSSAPSGATTYDYDANGNETAEHGGPRTSSDYDARNRLVSVTQNGDQTRLSYFGTTQDELLSVGSTPFHSTVLGLAQAGSDTYVRDELGAPVAQNTSRGREYFLLDALGSVRALTGDSGSLSKRFNYSPYGRDMGPESPGAGTSRLGFAGGEVAAPGLYHFRARHYDPRLMRWTQLDPLNEVGDLREVNRYVYVGGDPTNLRDPSGLGIFDDATEILRTGLKTVGRTVLKVNGLVCYVRKSTAKGDTNEVGDDVSDAVECFNPVSGYGPQEGD